MKTRTIILLATLTVIAGITLYILTRHPVRNDYTTTPSDPPQFLKLAQLESNQGRDMSFRYPADETPPVSPYVFSSGMSRDQVLDLIRESMSRMSRWVVISEDRSAGRFEVVATTGLVRFKDDVVLELRQQENRFQLHMRSKSRKGKSDFGVNVKRIKEFFTLLDYNK